MLTRSKTTTNRLQQNVDAPEEPQGTITNLPTAGAPADSDNLRPEEITISESVYRGEGDNRSIVSRSSSVSVRRKTAEAQYQRKLAMIAAERAAAEENAVRAEYEAELARTGSGRSSRRSSAYTAAWVNHQHDMPVSSKNNKVISPSYFDAAQAEPTQATPAAVQQKPVENHDKPQAARNQLDVSQLLSSLAALKHGPAVPLPTFSGDISEWLLYKKTFDDTKTLYTAAENLSRLRVSLKGEPLNMIGSLLLVTNDPEDVIRALELYYAQPEQIIFNDVRTIRGMPRLGRSGKDLITLATKVRSCIRVMNLLNKNDYLFSPELFTSIFSKLTPLLQDKWMDFANIHSSDRPKLVLLAEFLECEASKRVRFSPCEDSSYTVAPAERPVLPATRPMLKLRTSFPITTLPRPAQHNNNRAVCNAATCTSATDGNLCLFCGGPKHNIRTCSQFLALPVEERLCWVHNAKMCPKCLKRSRHNWRFCRGKCISCGGNHNSLLHDSYLAKKSIFQKSDGNNMEVASKSKPLADVSCQSEPGRETVLSSKEVEVLKNNSISFPESTMRSGQVFLKIVPVIVSGPKGDWETFALLDDGSTISMIGFDLADELGLPGREDRVRIESVTGCRDGIKSKVVSFNIRGKNCTEVYSVSCARAMPSLSLSPQSVNAKDIESYQHLNDLTDQLTYTNGSPKVLIGICDWNLLIARENRLGKPAEPAAVRTALGWALYGSLSRFATPVLSINHCTVFAKDQELDILIKEHYSLDSLGVKQAEPYSASERRALNILEETTRRLPNGRFEVGLPWREDSPCIPNSFNHAITRLKSLEKRFKNDSTYMELYKSNIEAYVEKDYAEACLDSYQHSNYESRRWYLPHFGVVHPHKPGKLRIVHDAAAQTSGVSLNSLLLPGPDLLQSLLGILLRFREGSVALAGDIREMFPQIKIREEDRDCQRYLWYSDGPGTCIKEFRMSSLIFGATSSPFTAIYVKNKNAEEFRSIFPDAARAIIEDHYMDDFLGSTDSVEQAAKLAADVVHVHSLCGFQMREWVSNKPEALAQVPSDLIKQGFSTVDLDLGGATVRVLGLVWNPRNDTFTFNVNLLPPRTSTFTKRQVLRDLMRVYDPLGFLAPIIVKGKILFQRTWRLVAGWDENLPQDECANWCDWYKQVAQIRTLLIPRCYVTDSASPVQQELHIFVDASSEAYSCCLYWRYTNSDGGVSTSYIISKTRVAPLKPVTIPRLELQAALLGARLAATVCSELRQKPTRRVFWTDSRIVLSWIRRDPRDFKTFVGNRLGEISELTAQSDWRWIPTLQNVADDATRFNLKGPDPLVRWLKGPSFLLLPESDWPVEDISGTELEILPELEFKDIVVSCNNSVGVLNVDRFSSWIRLLRTTSRVVQFVRILKESCAFQTRQQRPHPLLARDVKKAEEYLLKTSQDLSFAAELDAIKRNRPIPSGSRLKKIEAIVDSRGFLTLDSRIRACAMVPENMRSPIILDGKCRIVKLLIGHYHEWAGHGHNELVINELRQRYHIIRLRPAVRSVAAACLKCRLKRAAPAFPATGDLPNVRLEHHQRPFTFTGLDYFGPVDVTIGRRHEKRYVALFTCLVSRAIHLELVHSLSADSAIMALRRFITRRGCPQRIYTDNATAFVGANREIRRLWDISDFAAEKKIEWHFLPPAAPFMAGVWERLVGTVKRSLAVTLSERSPKEETLVTLLAEVENVVNSRPLTHVPVATEDEPALTPNHFLIGTSSSLPDTNEPLTDSDMCGRIAWKKAMRLADHFWTRWVREYLPTLAPRRNQNRPVENLKVGDIVIIADCNLPRGIWPIGRITSVYPGRDGTVRVADVATAGGTLRRPVRKLVKICDAN